MQGRGPLLPTDEQYQKMEEEFGNAVTEKAEEEAARLLSLGVTGFWNFTGKELIYAPDEAVVENVHLGDSLMSLNYELCRQMSEKSKKSSKETE